MATFIIACENPACEERGVEKLADGRREAGMVFLSDERRAFCSECGEPVEILGAESVA